MGDVLEVLIPGKLEPFSFEIKELWDTETDESIECVNPGKAGQSVKMMIPINVEIGWILRRKK